MFAILATITTLVVFNINSKFEAINSAIAASNVAIAASNTVHGSAIADLKSSMAIQFEAQKVSTSANIKELKVDIRDIIRDEMKNALATKAK